MNFIQAKTIVSGYTENNAWFGNNYNMNIYKGCSHGCIYCDSRSECYRIDNFDVVRAKENAFSLIEHDLNQNGKMGQNQREWYYKELDELFSTVKEKYIKNYGNAYECRSPKEKELWSLFKDKCKHFGILYKMDDIIRAYKDKYKDPQISLFE